MTNLHVNSVAVRCLDMMHAPLHVPTGPQLLQPAAGACHSTLARQPACTCLGPQEAARLLGESRGPADLGYLFYALPRLHLYGNPAPRPLTSRSSGYRESSSSMATPSRASRERSLPMSCSAMGWSLPYTSPEASCARVECRCQGVEVVCACGCV
jgi:hypothetical protein